MSPHIQPPAVLATLPGGIVAAQRFEILFRDGTDVGLHMVWKNGTPVPHLRALPYGESLVVFDLNTISQQLVRELAYTPARDVPGLVFYTLRQLFTTADLLALHAVKHALHICPRISRNAAPQLEAA